MELERLQSNKSYKDLCLQAHKYKYFIKRVRLQALDTIFLIFCNFGLIKIYNASEGWNFRQNCDYK